MTLDELKVAVTELSLEDRKALLALVTTPKTNGKEA
jgi:hypothetical protein